MRCPRRARPALTLVEAIIALVILSVAVPPMLWGLREAHASRTAPTLASTARWLAAEKLEDIIADRHSPSRGYAYLHPANYPPEPAVPGFPTFSREVALARTGPDLASPGEGYTTITVTVAWRDPRGTPRSLSLATVVTDYAP